MMHARQIGKVITGWPGICAFLASVHWLGSAGAASYGYDPVEDLRQALKSPVMDAKNPDELDYRKALLEKRAKAVRNADIRRALVLLEWKDKDNDEGLANIDRTVRRDLIKRFSTWVTELFKRTDRPSADAQLGAIETLGEMGIALRGEADKSALARDLGPALAGVVQDSPIPAVRQAAARALGKINPDANQAVEVLGKLLGSADVQDRSAAADGLAGLVRVLGQLTEGRTSPAGVEVLPAVALQTAQLVATTAGRGLADSDRAVRKLALEAVQLCASILGDLVGDPPTQDFPPTDRKLTPQEQKQIEDYRKEVESKLASYQPLVEALVQQIGPLTQCLHSSQPAQIRLLAEQTLFEMGDARRKMVRYAESVPKIETKAGAARRGRPSGPAQTVLLPVAALQAAPPKTDQLEAGMVKAIGPLTDRLADPDVAVRIWALEALITLGEAAKPATDAAISALNDPDHFVRWAAVRLLGKIGRPAQPERVVWALVPLLRDPDLDVELATAAALSIYGRHAARAVPGLDEHLELGAIAIFSYTSCWPPAYGYIRFREDQGDAEMRLAAIHTLQAIGPQAAAAAGAVKALNIDLLDRDVRVRRAAAEAVAQFGPLARSTAANLLKLLDDPDPDVRRAAGDALLAISGDK